MSDILRNENESEQGKLDRMSEKILTTLGFRQPVSEDAASVDLLARDDIDCLSEKIVSSERAWEGSFLKVDDVQVELPNGKLATRDIVRHPGAVAIIALDENNRVLLVNQYRAALERVTLEIPAGKLDFGEDALACAKRELEEETGYRAGKISYLIPIAVAAGYSDEIIHLFMATEMTPVGAHPDEDEFVISQWMDLGALIDLVLDGKIEDSKTVIAALACDAMARRL